MYTCVFVCVCVCKCDSQLNLLTIERYLSFKGNLIRGQNSYLQRSYTSFVDFATDQKATFSSRPLNLFALGFCRSCQRSHGQYRKAEFFLNGLVSISIAFEYCVFKRKEMNVIQCRLNAFAMQSCFWNSFPNIFPQVNTVFISAHFLHEFYILLMSSIIISSVDFFFLLLILSIQYLLLHSFFGK